MWNGRGGCATNILEQTLVNAAITLLRGSHPSRIAWGHSIWTTKDTYLGVSLYPGRDRVGLRTAQSLPLTNIDHPVGEREWSWIGSRLESGLSQVQAE
jgi:hypothetical protein